MKKIILLFTLILLVQSLVAQRFYLSNNSSVKFFSEAKMENISAINQKANAVIDFEKQEIAVKIPMRDFVFPVKLMQEHFNENYVESGQFPYATFKGFFSKKIDLSQSTNTSLSVSGTMTIHGISKMEIIQGRITIDAPHKSVILESNFNVKLEDYNIKVPTIVIYKIAEKISVNAQFMLSPVIQGRSPISSSSPFRFQEN